MKIFNTVYLIVLLALGVFAFQSHRADAYMTAEIQHSAQRGTPYLKPLTVRVRSIGRAHRYIQDTPSNRKIYSASWIVAPGDGRLYYVPSM
jgi:hypothetical protein